MSEASTSKVLLIDLENCPSQIKKILSDIEVFSRVVICYANGNPKIPLDWLVPLASAVNAGKLHIVKMDNGGKNAADFGICFFAGMLMQELPKDTHFVIVSNDTDLDHAVGLLRSHGRTAERVGAKVDKPEVIPAAPNPVSHPPELGACCALLLKHVHNRPGSEQALMNSLQTACGKNQSKAELIFKVLINTSAIKLESGNLSYDDAQLKKLAAVNN